MGEGACDEYEHDEYLNILEFVVRDREATVLPFDIGEGESPEEALVAMLCCSSCRRNICKNRNLNFQMAGWRNLMRYLLLFADMHRQ